MSEPRDFYAEYYAAKLWALLPEIHRDEDGRAPTPGQLRAFLAAVGEHAAHAKRSQDALWDDAFIDLCADWAVPYLGELVATRLVSSLNKAGRRVDVAKTIYYRRRKGTLRVLEELVADIARWDGKVVEEFRRLARAWHGLDGKAAEGLGRHTRTPAGGFADVRNVRGALLAGGPFDEFHSTPDVRKPRGRDGRLNIPTLGFHLYRLRASRLVGIDPFPWPGVAPDPFMFSIDPSGRDVPLFIPPIRGIYGAGAHPPAFVPLQDWVDWDQWRSAQEWELCSPMRCRVLNHAEYLVDDAVALAVRNLPGVPVAVADALARFAGTQFPGEPKLRATLALLPDYAALAAAQQALVLATILALALVPDCGKAALAGEAGSARAIAVRLDGINAVPRESFGAANLSVWNRTAPGKVALLDPNRGRLAVPRPAPANFAPRIDCYYGFCGPIGAGTYDRAASLASPLTRVVAGGGALAPIVDGELVEWRDSRTYTGPGPVANVTSLVLQAGDQERPYVQMTQPWVFTGAAGVQSRLVLDGLWLGALAGTPGPVSLTLRGTFDQVVLRHMTLDPGGQDASGGTIVPTFLRIEGHVERLEIQRSIVGPIRVLAGGSVESIEAFDAILDGRNAPAVPAGTGRVVNAALGRLMLRRATVLAPRRTHADPAPLALDVNVDVLDASDSLVAGRLDVTDTQSGCFRFSAAATGSRIPHPYESVVMDDTAGLFVSQRFGDPAYGQLRETAPASIRRGAENDGEMGAFAGLMNPIRFDGLQAKVSEYEPFGRIPSYLFET